MHHYTVGDRVSINKLWNLYSNTSGFSGLSKNICGMIGTVVEQGYNILVEFDEHIGGHNGNGNNKRGHCYWIPQECIVFLESEPNGLNIKQKIELKCSLLY